MAISSNQSRTFAGGFNSATTQTLERLTSDTGWTDMVVGTVVNNTTENGWATVTAVSVSGSYTTITTLGFINDQTTGDTVTLYPPILVNGYKESGTSSGTSTSTTLEATGAGWTSSDYVNYIVWITSGTGSGQSRRITANDADTLTIEPAWDTTPTTGSSVYKILYSIADIEAIANTATGSGMADWQTDAGDFSLDIKSVILIESGGGYGAVQCMHNFTIDRAFFFSDAGSYFQLGYKQSDGYGHGGGQIAARNNSRSYSLPYLRGSSRLYSIDVMLHKENLYMERVMTLNSTAASIDEFELIDSSLNGLGFYAHDGDTIRRVKNQGRSYTAISGNPAAYEGVINNSYTLGVTGATSGAELNNWEYHGDADQANVTSKRPLFSSKGGWPDTVDSKMYFMSADFGTTYSFSDCMWWHGTDENQGRTYGFLYNGQIINLATLDSSNSALASVSIYLEDSSNNAAWYYSQDGNYDPNKRTVETTDGSGLYSAKVITAKQIKDALLNTGITTAYNPFVMRVAKYGYVFQSLNRDWVVETTENISLATNSFVTLSETNAGNLTGIAVNGSAKTITVSYVGTHTVEDIYDYTQWWYANGGVTGTNMQYDIPIATADGINFILNTDWDLLVTGNGTIGSVNVLQTGKKVAFQGTGALTVSADGAFEDDNGVVWEVAGSVYKASNISLTFKEGATAEANVWAAIYDSGDVNRLYNTSYAETEIESNGSGVVSGYLVYEIGGTTYSGFVTTAKQYGYARIANPETSSGTSITKDVLITEDTRITEATEATVAAYTGFTVSASGSTMVLGSTHTVTELYDHLQYHASLQSSIAYPEGLTTSNGVDYVLTTGWKFTLNQNLTYGSNRLSGGTIIFPTAISLTPTLGTIACEFTAASGTYTFETASDLSGTLDLINTGGGSITVALPTGTSFTNTGPNITVDTATIAQGRTFTGLIAGSLVKVFNNGLTTERFSTLSSGTSETWTETYSSDVTFDYVIMKVGYLPIQVVGGVAGQNVSTIPITQIADRAFVASSGLTYGTTATITSGTKVFQVTTATTVQNWYSFCIEEWINNAGVGKTTADLANVAFPLSTSGPNSFTLENGWVWADGATSIAYLSRDGMRYLNTSDVVTGVWCAVLSSGVPSGKTARYQQVAGTGEANASNTGNVDQLIKIYEDTNGDGTPDYDYTGHLTFKFQDDTYDEGFSDVYETYGTLEDQLYVIGLAPVSNGVAAKSVTGITITKETTPQSWNGNDYSITIIDTNGTQKTAEEIMQYVRGLNDFDYGDLIRTNGTKFKTVRNRVEGDSSPTLHGVRVLKADESSPHIGFNLYTSDDGTEYVPPDEVTVSLSGLSYNTNTTTDIVFTTTTIASTTIDLTKYYNGQSVTITGSASNNGTFTVSEAPTTDLLTFPTATFTAGTDTNSITLNGSQGSRIQITNTTGNSESVWAASTAYTKGGGAKQLKTFSVISIERTGNTATVICNADPQMVVNTHVLMAGADQTRYNGIFDVLTITTTTVTNDTFTFEVGGSPTSPATGTITTKQDFMWFECLIAGTSSGTEPATWNTTIGGETTDNGVTWVSRLIQIDNSIATESDGSYSIQYEHLGTDRTLTFRIMYIVGTHAMKYNTFTGVVTSAGLTSIVNQEDNDVYNANNIDGSTVTEVTVVEHQVKIYIDDPDNTTTAQRIYNWFQYWLDTADGIQDQADYMTTTDQTHYTLTSSQQIVNLDTSNPLAITGANIVPSSGTATSILDVTNGASIILNYERVEAFTYSTGSGLSSAEQQQITDILADTADIQPKVTILDTVADGIQTDLSNATDGLGALKTLIDANQTDLNTIITNVATVDGIVDAILVDSGTSIPALIAALNDVAATDIVSNGAITTLTGAVVTVTNNTDMRGTDSANTVAPDNSGIAANQTDLNTIITNLSTAQSDLDTITGVDGVTLATLQALYAPNKTAPDNSGIAANQTDLNTIIANLVTLDTVADGIQTDLSNGTDGLGALKTLIEANPTVTEIWAKVVETNGSITAQQAVSILLAAAAGEFDAATDVFKDPSGTSTRIDSSSTSGGSRGTSTLTPSS